MERPTATLVRQAIALDRIVEAAGAGDEAGLAEALDRLHDGGLIEVLQLVGGMANLSDAVGSAVAGVVAVRSDRGAEESLTKRLGERSAPIAVAATAHVALRRAIDWCTLGQALGVRRSLVGDVLPTAYPTVSAALAAGAIGAEAAELVVDTLTVIAPKRDLAQLEADEAFLVENALVQTTQGLRQICKSCIAHADPDGLELREADLVEKAGMKVIQRRNGMTAFLAEADPESAGFLLTALEARTSPRRMVVFDDPDSSGAEEAGTDNRTLARKRLDAFVSNARDSLKHDDGDISGIAAKVLVVIDSEAMMTGIGSATIAGIEQPISAKTARRIACDAQIYPVVLGGQSQILDFGEGRRLFSENQRLAMVARDGGCGWWTCSEPPGRCQAAHVKAWEQGAGRPKGRTGVLNGILLCPFHHRLFDTQGWTLRNMDGVPYFIPPPWIDPARTPRRAGRPRPPT